MEMSLEIHIQGLYLAAFIFTDAKEQSFKL